MAAKRFSKRANFMLAPMHVEMLQALADRDAITTSDVVRRLIVESHRATFGHAEVFELAQPARKKARKRK